MLFRRESWNLFSVAIALLVVLIGGTFGYHFIEGFDYLNALYQTVITITTVGFGEVQPLSPHGKLFTIILIGIGLGIVTYGLTQVGRWLLEIKLLEIFGRRGIKGVKKLENHYIICGYGRMGSAAVERLIAEKVPFVIIDNNPEAIDESIRKSVPFIIGDATEEEILKTAKIEKARGLAALLPTDADNLYLVLTARAMNPGLIIVSRAITEEAERKLYRAGANHVIAPYRISGRRIALHLVNPSLMDFVDLAILKKDLELEMREYTVPEGSPLDGHSIKDLDIRKKTTVVVVAVRRNGKMIINPDPELVLKAGDILLLLGENKMLERFYEIFVQK